jgi:hypothetical protein
MLFRIVEIFSGKAWSVGLLSVTSWTRSLTAASGWLAGIGSGGIPSGGSSSISPSETLELSCCCAAS